MLTVESAVMSEFNRMRENFDMFFLIFTIRDIILNSINAIVAISSISATEKGTRPIMAFKGMERTLYSFYDYRPSTIPGAMDEIYKIKYPAGIRISKSIFLSSILTVIPTF